MDRKLLTNKYRNRVAQVEWPEFGCSPPRPPVFPLKNPKSMVGKSKAFWFPTHPYLIKYFILVQVRPIEQSIYWLHRAAAAARCINQLRMVRWVPELNGANDHHGLGGEFGFLRWPYGVRHGQEKLKNPVSTPTTTPRRISYVGICRISTGA